MTQAACSSSTSAAQQNASDVYLHQIAFFRSLLCAGLAIYLCIHVSIYVSINLSIYNSIYIIYSSCEQQNASDLYLHQTAFVRSMICAVAHRNPAACGTICLLVWGPKCLARARAVSTQYLKYTRAVQSTGRRVTAGSKYVFCITPL